MGRIWGERRYLNQILLYEQIALVEQPLEVIHTDSKMMHLFGKLVQIHALLHEGGVYIKSQPRTLLTTQFYSIESLWYFNWLHAVVSCSVSIVTNNSWRMLVDYARRILTDDRGILADSWHSGGRLKWSSIDTFYVSVFELIDAFVVGVSETAVVELFWLCVERVMLRLVSPGFSLAQWCGIIEFAMNALHPIQIYN